MAKRFTLSDVINVRGDGNCFFHALKVGLDNIFSSYRQPHTITGKIEHDTLRQNIVEGLLQKINVPIEEFKKIAIPIPGAKGEQWPLASYHGLNTNASNDEYRLAQKQLIAHLERMKTSETFATDLEVFGAQLYFQELMKHVRRKPEFAKLGEIKIGVYTPPRNNPPFLQGNEDDDRNDNDAVIRIINESGYTVNGWHFDALPSTNFGGNLKGKTVERKRKNTKQKESNYTLKTAKLHFEYLKKEMSKVSAEITEYNNINNGNYQKDYKEAVKVVIGKLSENKQILINELINLYIGTSNIKKQFSNTMESYLHEQLDISERNITTPVKINFNDIKAGIGLELKLPLFAKLGITKYCCQTGGGMKKKHKRKTTKRTKGKKEKKGRKWSKKYKDSINCKKPKGFSQRQHCLAKSKKRKTAKKN